MKMRNLRTSLEQWRPGLGRATPLDTLRAAWPGIVGADIARHAFPTALENGALIITTRSGAWSQQLGFLEQTVLPQLQQAVAGENIQRLLFRVGRLTLRAATAPPKRQIVQQRLGLQPATPPAASMEELVARIGKRLVERERRLAKHPRCKSCAIPLRQGEYCAPCSGRLLDERLRQAQRVLAEMPWLNAPQIQELVPGLTLAECRSARRSLQSRLEQQLELIRWRLRKGGEPRSAERSAAIAYAMLVTGEPPSSLAQPLLRNVLGASLADLLYPQGV